MTTTNSPGDDARDLPREPTALWIIVLMAGLVAVWLGVLAWQFAVLPEQMPTRFDASGEPVAWSSRTVVLLFSLLLPLLTALPLPLVSLLALHRPAALSMPNRDWWTATAPRIRRFERLLREDMWLVAALMLMLFVAIQVIITEASVTPGGALPWYVIQVPVMVFLVGLGALMMRMFRGRYAEQDVTGP